MKKIINLSILILGICLLTGCSIKTPIDNSFVEAKVNKDLRKVSNEEIHYFVNPTNNVNQRASGIFGSGVVFETDTGGLNNLILDSYLKQYFKNIQTDNNISNKGIYINSKIDNFDFRFGAMNSSSTVEVNLSIKAYYNGELIINKKYKGNKTITGVSLTKLTVVDLYSETFHEAVLNIYKNEFQKDLLTALKTKVEQK